MIAVSSLEGLFFISLSINFTNAALAKVRDVNQSQLHISSSGLKKPRQHQLKKIESRNFRFMSLRAIEPNPC